MNLFPSPSPVQSFQFVHALLILPISYGMNISQGWFIGRWWMGIKIKIKITDWWAPQGWGHSRPIQSTIGPESSKPSKNAQGAMPSRGKLIFLVRNWEYWEEIMLKNCGIFDEDEIIKIFWPDLFALFSAFWVPLAISTILAHKNIIIIFIVPLEADRLYKRNLRSVWFGQVFWLFM